MISIEKFLVMAKKQSYANGTVEKVLSSRLNSKDYEYKSGNMVYHDTYFGGTKFIGEEVVYVNHQTYWAMNYYGITFDDTLEEEVIDKVLRPALMMVGEDKTILPVRGPREFIHYEYKYTFEVEGSLDYFNGTERIYKNDIKVYELKCTGGFIQ